MVNMTVIRRSQTALSFLVLLGILLSTSGCFEGDKKPEEAKKDIGVDKIQVEGDEEAGDEESSESTPKKDLNSIAALPFTEVQAPVSDGLMIYGRLYDPSQKSDDGEEVDDAKASADDAPEAPVQKYPLVILLHGLDGRYNDWGNFPVKLVKQGYAVFAVDLRGHGNSTSVGGKPRIFWRDFTTEDWNKMPGDIDKVIDFLGKNEETPQVDNHQVAIIGASIGANTALNAASQKISSVKAVALLSPGIEYKGLSSTTAILYYTNALFIAASQQDPYSYQSSESLYKWGQGPKAIRLYRNIGHGTDMLKQEPKLGDEIIRWLNVKMGKAAPPSAPSDVKPTASNKT